MATSNKIFVQIDDKKIELTGTDKEAFIADQEARQAEVLLLETEYKAKQDARASAITKLSKIAGLTEEEIEGLIR